MFSSPIPLLLEPKFLSFIQNIPQQIPPGNEQFSQMQEYTQQFNQTF